MFLSSTSFRAICSVLIAAALSIGVLGDTIRLKDGSIIKGRIVSFAGGRFVVAVGDGSRRREMTFSAAEVESIQFDADQLDPDRTGPATPIARDTVTSQDRNSTSTTTRGTGITAKIIYPERQPARTDTAPYGGAPARTDDPPATTTPARPNPSRANASLAKPVELNVKVRGDNTANGWTNSGWVVKKGQRIRISGSGEISIGGGKKVTPSGAYDIDDGQKLLKNVPTGALLAVIGDDNNDFIYIGSDREFVAERDGALFLGINEGNLNDNSGTFDVKIEIRPDGDE